MKSTLIAVVIISALSGCAYFAEKFGDDVLDQVDKAMVRICKLPEADRKPIRDKIWDRYRVDTSPACPHLKGNT